MFCLKTIRMNGLNKIAINLMKLNIINTKYMSHSIGVKSNAINANKPVDRPDISAKEGTHLNQFLSDGVFRRDLLQNIFILSLNVSNGKRGLNELIDEKDLTLMCGTVEENVRYLRNKELINCLHSFLVMGLDSNTKFVQSLENELLWRARGMSLKELLTCLSYHKNFQSSEQQMKVFNELIISLVLKLDNAEDAEDIVRMLSLWRALGPKMIEKIESIAVDLIGRSDPNQFRVESLSYILVLLSKMNRRSKPLISAVVNKFTYTSMDTKECKEKHLIQMISALNELNYSDIHFLKKSCDLLCNKRFLNTVPPSDRRDLLVAVSQSNWPYIRLLDEYIERMTDTNNDFSSQDFLVLVSSFARLYFRTNYLKEILSNYVIPYVKRNDFNADSWLLYVWSLSILGSVPLKCINSVMNYEFYNELMSQTNSETKYKQIVSKLKLLNIKAVAEIEMNETIDFEPLSHKDYELPKKEVSLEKFKKSILQILNSFVLNMNTNVLTPFGFAIDAEFIVNRENESLVLEEYGLLGADRSMQLQTLPEGFQRVALMCFRFNDQLLGETGLIGVHELSIRLLERLGYSVVVVNESQMPVHLTNSQKIERLKALIHKSFDSVSHEI